MTSHKSTTNVPIRVKRKNSLKSKFLKRSKSKMERTRIVLIAAMLRLKNLNNRSMCVKDNKLQNLRKLNYQSPRYTSVRFVRQFIRPLISCVIIEGLQSILRKFLSLLKITRKVNRQSLKKRSAQTFDL